MNFLEQKILADGVVKPGNVLKVDSFLNHQIDIRLMQKIGEEFKRRFADVQFNKVLTIEASGIAIAAFIAYLNDVPVVFAKRVRPSTAPTTSTLPRHTPSRTKSSTTFSFRARTSSRPTKFSSWMISSPTVKPARRSSIS